MFLKGIFEGKNRGFVLKTHLPPKKHEKQQQFLVVCTKHWLNTLLFH